MAQTCTWSWIEATISYLLTLATSVVAQLLLLPIFYPHIHPTLSASLGISAVLFVVGVPRNYFVRRVFHWMTERQRFGQHPHQSRRSAAAMQ